MTTRPLHADIVLNHWAEHYQELLGRVLVDFESRPDLAEAWLKEFTERHDGSYLFVTEPHHPSDCPFLGKNRLDMIYEKVNPDEFDFEPGREVAQGD